MVLHKNTCLTPLQHKEIYLLYRYEKMRVSETVDYHLSLVEKMK